MQPAERLGHHEGEGHAEGQVGLEEVEAEEDGLPVRLLQEVDERASHSLHEDLPRGQGPHAHGILNGDLGEVHLAHDRMLPVPVHDHGRLDASQHLDGHVGRRGIDEDEPAGPELCGADAIEDHHVESLHAPLVGVGLAHLELDLGIGRQLLLEEEIAGAHEQDVDGADGRNDGIGDVVGREVVGNVEPRPHHAAALVGEGHHHRAPHLRLQGQRLLGHDVVVEGEGEAERLGLIREVHHGQEGLGVVGADVVAPHRQVGDGHVAAALSHADPAHAHVVRLAAQGRRVGPVGEDVDLRAGVLPHEGAGGPHGLPEPIRQVAWLGPADGGQGELAIAAEGREHARLHGRLDDHDLGADAQPAHEPEGLALGADEA